MAKRNGSTHEITRTREHGTRVTVPASGEERIAAIRTIHEEHQYAKVDGVMVDAFSASAILAIYDKLSAENQTRYRTMTAPKMAIIAFRLINKVA